MEFSSRKTDQQISQHLLELLRPQYFFFRQIFRNSITCAVVFLLFPLPYITCPKGLPTTLFCDDSYIYLPFTKRI
jgi:hypothetical protein